MSKIEWTGITWNPFRGCSEVSPGCRRCYAANWAHARLAGEGKPYEGLTKTKKGTPHWTGEVRTIEHQLDAPRRMKKPRLIFTCSMSDFFHELIPEQDIERVVETMRATPQHTYQVLTKRSKRMRRMSWKDGGNFFPPNVWLGVSIESNRYLDRLLDLRNARAALRFVSLEPVLGPLDEFNPEGLDWVIVGGESGPGATGIEPEQARALRDKCVAARVPFFFKQWGGRYRTRAGRILDGRYWDERPEWRRSV